jgi:hypothetical protein
MKIKVFVSASESLNLYGNVLLLEDKLEFLQLMGIIRKRCRSLLPAEALFGFIKKENDKYGSVLPRMSSTLGELYKEYGYGEGLHVDVTTENAFGWGV